MSTHLPSGDRCNPSASVDHLFMAHPLDHRSVAAGPWATPFSAQQNVPVTDGLEGLQALALQGRWREVAKWCGATTATDTAAALSVAAYHVLALFKLKMHEQAAAELSKLGSLDDGSYASSKAQGIVSLVPFSLRVLKCEVPWQLGRQQEAINRLYHLLEWCAAQQKAPPAAIAEGSGGQQQQLWRRRHRGVLLSLVNKHCQLRQFTPALSLLNQLLSADASDIEAWVETGTVQAMLGDVSAAQRTLQQAEELLADGGGGSMAGERDVGLQRQRRQLLVHRNRGLLQFLQRDYRGAAREFAAALALDPSDVAAINNRAVSLMYSCQLSEAVQELEGAFSRMPAAMMLETVVVNLASLYELAASAASLGAKQHMAEWVAAAAPDDFDLACTKTVGA